jgi:hypothetical protein
MTNEQRAVFRVPASQPTPHPTRPSRAFILAPMTQPPQETAHARSSQHQSTLCWGTICQRAERAQALSDLSRCVFFLFALLLLGHGAGLEFGRGLALLLGGHLRRFCILAHGACQQNALQAAANACAAARSTAAELGGSPYAQSPPRSARQSTGGTLNQGTGLHAVQMRRRQPARRALSPSLRRDVESSGPSASGPDRSRAPPHAALY